MPSSSTPIAKELLDPAAATPSEVASILEPSASSSSSALPAWKVSFIEKALEAKALLFGEFTLKSGRLSPYFFNAGLLYSGSLLSTIAQSYASSLLESPIGDFDVLFGPAYKGISLAAITAMALHERHGKEVDFCYNRKEKKDHGEGGSMVGAELKGRVVLIDDVLTRGVAIREAISLLPSSATLAGIIVLVDRQERGNSPTSKQSTIQEVSAEFGVPIVPIIGMSDVMTWMEGKGGLDKELALMREYKEKWGAEGY